MTSPYQPKVLARVPGLTWFNRRFVHHYAHIAAFLSDLLKKINFFGIPLLNAFLML